MVDKIVKGIVGLFGGNMIVGGKQLIVFLISLMPILELRGGLIAASLLKLDPWQSYIISIVGNVLPIPFILSSEIFSTRMPLTHTDVRHNSSHSSGRIIQRG